jgi:hypothetical protein
MAGPGAAEVEAIATEVVRLLANAPRRAQMDAGRFGRWQGCGAKVCDAIRRWQVSEGTRT